MVKQAEVTAVLGGGRARSVTTEERRRREFRSIAQRVAQRDRRFTPRVSFTARRDVTTSRYTQILSAAMHADTLSLIQRFHSPPGAAGSAVLAARVTELQIRLQAAHQELAAERAAAQAAKELVLQNADRCAVELVRQVREAQARASKNVGALRDTLVQRDLETRELREALARRAALSLIHI